MRTLASSGLRWPWPRKKMAEVVDILAKFKPKAIVIDILFQNSESEEEDKILANSIKSFKNTFLISILEEKSDLSGTTLSKFSSLEIFSDVANEGFVWGKISPDGRLRDFKVFDDRVNSESCALKVLKQFNPGTKNNLFSETLPIIFPKNNGGIPVLSLNQLLDPQKSLKARIKDKVLVLGVNAQIVHDYHNTPLGVMSGAEILAASIDTLLSQRIAGYYVENRLARTGMSILGIILALGCLTSGVKVIFSTLVMLFSFFFLQILLEIFLCFLPSISFVFGWTLTATGVIGARYFLSLFDLQRMRHEAENAKVVQEQILPTQSLDFNGFKVAGIQKAADELGGDYFDFFVIKNQHILVIIGDATGHGMPAALAVAVAKASVLSALNFDLDSANVACHLSKTLFLSLKRRLMMTAAIVLLDTKTGEFEYRNCGHPYPYMLGKDEEIVQLEASGSFLGTKETYRPGKPYLGKLKSGERLIFYTDGLVESLDEDKHVDAFEIFRNYLSSRPDMPAEQACNDILENHPFVLSQKSQPDDFTVVIIEKV